MSPAQSTACLPAFYANLDVKSIPTPSEMDTGAPLAWAHPVNCVGVSMYSICRLHRIPLGAFPDLWPRLAEGGRQSLSHRPRDDMQDFVKFVGSFKSKDILDLMLATPGFRYMVTCAWISRLDDTEEHSLNSVYPDVSRLILETSETIRRADVQELIDGAGGHYTDLAALLIRHTHAVLPTPESPSLLILDVLTCMIEFLPDVDAAFEGRMPGEVYPLPGAFGEALLAQGLVGAFTSIMYAVSDVFEPGGTLLADCVHWLTRTLSYARWHSLVAEALDAGLLYSIASCIADGAIPEQAMTSYRNVKRLNNGFLQAQPVLVTEEFQSSKLAPLWRTFVTSSNERVVVMYDFNAGAGPDRRACDNIKANPQTAGVSAMCGVFELLLLLPRVSTHRLARRRPQSSVHVRQLIPLGYALACVIYDSLGLTSHTGEQQHDLSARERAFLRAVLLQDYKEGQWSTVAAQHLSFMAKHPGEAYFTLFDYRRGRVDIYDSIYH
ncbi:hypothetical protein DFH06DRAFT_1327473 [Mycena polygramma]|nr:hypothetical protein DFH06DRAFT_1327473 [Mycena polygramma]